jgi:hypothetical protein
MATKTVTDESFRPTCSERPAPYWWTSGRNGAAPAG